MSSLCRERFGFQPWWEISVNSQVWIVISCDIVIPCGIGLLYPVIGSHHGLGVGGVEESKAVTKFMGERLKKAGPLKIHISVSTFEVGFFM